MRCPRCDGYIWSEVERGGDPVEIAKRYGLEVVCIAGHRIKLSVEDYQRYLREKRRKESGNRI